MFSNLKTPAHRSTFPVAAATLIVALALAGCKGFWDPLPATGTGTGTGTGTTATTTSLTASGSTVAAGGGLNLTATVAPAAATGTVSFYAGSSTIGTAALTSGTAAFTATFSAPGTESLTATYSGDNTYAASTSSAVVVTVTAAAAAAPARPALQSTANPDTALVLSPESTWTAPAALHLRNLARIAVEGSTATNIDSRHCILYSGTVFLADGTKFQSAVYDLQSGGYLAPEDKAPDLGCQ